MQNNPREKVQLSILIIPHCYNLNTSNTGRIGQSAHGLT